MINKIKSLLLLIVILNLYTITKSQNKNQEYQNDKTFHKMFLESIALEEKGELEKSIENNLKIIKIFPKAVEVYNSISGIYGLLGQYDNQMQWAHKAIKLDSSYVMAYSNLGNAYSAKKEFDKGLEIYNLGLKLEPNNVLLNYNIGCNFEVRENYYVALIYFITALEHDNTHEDSRIYVATCFANLKLFDEALAIINIAYKNNPKSDFIKDLKIRLEKEIKSN
jgi:tetratricopeptide (TPR) repeat protein